MLNDTTQQRARARYVSLASTVSIINACYELRIDRRLGTTARAIAGGGLASWQFRA
jgi:hypothetical protein